MLQNMMLYVNKTMSNRKAAHKFFLNIFTRYHLAVIATANPDTADPEAALVAYVYNDKLELFFQTNKYSRKAANLKRNPQVAFVMGLALEDLVTIQYQGRATQITKKEEREACKKMFIDRNSPTASPKYLEHPDAIYFKVVPTWVGCHDYRGKQPQVLELKNF